MAFSSGAYTRTDGTRSGTDVFVQQKNSGVLVTASLLDNEANDMATALSSCLLKDGTQTVTANIPMNSKKFTGLADGAAKTDSATVGQIQNSNPQWGGVAGGTANAITLSLTPAITAYAAGQRFSFQVSSANTAAVTLNINSVGSLNLVKKNLTAGGAVLPLVKGDISNNNEVYLITILDSSTALLLNPSTFVNGATQFGGSSGGTANAITISCTPPIPAIPLGLRLSFAATSTNTGAATLNVDGLGAVAIKKRASVSAGSVQDLTAGDIVNDAGISEVIYDGTEFILLNPAEVWQTWTITHTGFSVNPTYVARYKVQGKTVTCHYTITAGGTSNATGYTVTAPVTAKTIAGMFWYSLLIGAVDNGSIAAAGAYASIASAGTTITLFNSTGGGLWTNTGTKYAPFSITYEIA